MCFYKCRSERRVRISVVKGLELVKFPSFPEGINRKKEFKGVDFKVWEK